MWWMFPALLLALGVCGCSHALEIQNLDRFSGRMADTSQAGLVVGVMLDSRNAEDEAFAQSVILALSQQAQYSVIYPATPATLTDVTIRLSLVGKEKSGSAGNFFVCFPGFLLFTHAWLGYAYHYGLTARCDMTASVTGEHIKTLDVPIRLDMRHAEFDRTWANGYVGWIYLGLPCFFNGFFCIPYDPDLDPELRQQAFPALGAHVASEIIRTLNALPWQLEDEAWSY